MMDPLEFGKENKSYIADVENPNNVAVENDNVKMEKKVDQDDSSTETGDQDISVEIEESSVRALIYKVSESPPVFLLIMFALQQCLIAIANPLSKAIIVSEVVCSSDNDKIKTQILSATLLMTGVATFLMPTVGVRLPIFQGPASSYMVPLISMMTLKEWKCPEAFDVVDPETNETVTYAIVGNETKLMEDIIEDKIRQLSGSLMVAGFLHFLIGITGFVGVILRYVGPVTVVPTVVLVGLQVKSVAVKFSETNWAVAAITAGTSLIFSLFLGKKKTPIPLWTPKQGFHILWYPLHQVFSILLGIMAGWAVSGLMTEFGALSDDPDSKEYLARTDARTKAIDNIDWFIFPYPGMYGMVSFSVGGFISFFVATILSVLDSIGDYNACARTAKVPPPPPFAFNRGIAVEGLVSFFGGTLGCCHATSSYGGNIGAMGITRVMSRSVFQLAGIIYIIFAILGKVGAAFVTIPYSVLGGITIIIMGIFIGVILSYLQTIDLNSTRNLAIIGTSMLLGVMMPLWVSKNPNAIDTGDPTVDSSLKMLLTNPSFIGGAFAFIMDNTTPGTLRERGVFKQLQETMGNEGKSGTEFVEGLEIYHLPFLPESFRKSKAAKYIPFVAYTGDK